MAKRRKNQCVLGDMSEMVDRISCLPIPLLHHIFSFLLTKDVVRTCVLSKNWIDIWCSVPTLSFDMDSFGTVKTQEEDKFVKFVDSVLILREGTNISKFQLLAKMTSADRNRVNVWIKYAMKHNVEVLDIRCRYQTELTPYIFTSKSLIECKMSHSFIKLPSSIHLPALKVLHLENVRISFGQLNETFFSAIPSLETLIIFNYYAVYPPFVISSRQLKNLKIEGAYPDPITISAPNLVSFELKQNEMPGTIRSECSAMYLSSAIVNALPRSSGSIAHLIYLIKGVRSLTLSVSLSYLGDVLQKDLSIQKCFQTPFYNLKWLKIETLFGEDELFLINNFLKHSPAIETVFFVNKMGNEKFCTTAVEHSEAEQLSKHKLSHLKLVKFQDFHGSENEIKLLKFLLGNAMVLEKLIIMVAKFKEWSSEDKQKLEDLGVELLAFPRASSSVGILFLQNT